MRSTLADPIADGWGTYLLPILGVIAVGLATACDTARATAACLGDGRVPDEALLVRQGAHRSDPGAASSEML